MDASDVLERLAALSAEFQADLPVRIARIEGIWKDVHAARTEDVRRKAMDLLHAEVHTLAGGGKSFGFPLVSKAAAPIDSLIRDLIERDRDISSDEKDQIDTLVKWLIEAAKVAPEPITFDVTNDSPPASDEPVRPRILILSGAWTDEQDRIKTALENYGFEVSPAGPSETLPASILGGAPGILIVDTDTDQDMIEYAQRTRALKDLPLLVASQSTGFENRLNAVRSGADVFLPKPFTTNELIDRLVELEDEFNEAPYRVVIAEDDGPLAHFYQLTLEHAGISTLVVSKPEALLDTLSGFDADLILMDLYMPSCDGFELAQIVRQFPAYMTVPILFLSTESRLSKHLQALQHGGDDFLIKPLQPDQVVSAVRSRAKRYRELKKLTDRDSLTGLLNHTNILRNLDREMNNSKRTGSQTSLAMVDIDHFKKVNDTYGHVVGDQVLVRVSHLIRNRLRRTDHIGRYGGEEFAIVMPDTTQEQAHKIIEELRLAAKAVEHRTSEGCFNITFSGGIAAYPVFGSKLDITKAADEALYRAKSGGRDQTVVASPPD